jgi:hypothetical protein
LRPGNHRAIARERSRADRGNQSSVDVPEPPKIVLEQPAACADAARADEAFRAALAPSNAPGPDWVVRLRLVREGHELHATGEVLDRAGAPVAHRSIDRQVTSKAECAGLARAIGVWASLVLDAEVQRAQDDAPIPPPAPAPIQVGWPAPAPPPEKLPEAQLFLAHAAENRDVEIGAASLIMTGTGSGMIAGGSVFVVSEVGAGWFLRPSLAMGRTVTQVLPGSNAFATLGDGRFDACKRLPGNYLEERGLQLDLCAGPELGFLVVDPHVAGTASQTLPLLAFGPSIDFRGELGSAFSVLVRGVLDLNVLPASTSDGSVSEAIVIARAEVGLSLRLR